MKLLPKIQLMVLMMSLITYCLNAQEFKSPVPFKFVVSSFYVGADGAAYYFGQDGDRVYWAAEHSGKYDYCHVGEGTINETNNTIKGSWWCVPKYGATGTGTVTFQLVKGGALQVISQAGGFPTATLNPRALTQDIIDILPLQQEAAFTAHTQSDLDGVWVTTADPFSRVIYMRQIGDKVLMFVESRFAKSKLPAEAFVFIGERNGNNVTGSIAMVSKGIKRNVFTKATFLVTGENLMRQLGGYPITYQELVRVFPKKFGTDIDSYISGLPYDPKKLLAVRGDGAENPKRTQIGQKTTEEPGEDAFVICKKTDYNTLNNFSEIAILRPLAGVVFPGAMLRVNQALIDGTPELVTEIPRAPIKMSIDLPGFINGKGTLRVSDPTNSSVKSAIDNGLDWWNNNAYKAGYHNAGQSSYNEKVSYSSKQLAVELGINYASIGGSASAQFNYNSTSSKKVLLCIYRQVFYTVSVDQPNTASDWFEPWVTVDQVKKHFTATTPLAYVSNVSYGRILFVRIETTSKVDEISFRGAAKFFVGPGVLSGSLKTDYEKILKESSIEIGALGGDAKEISKIFLADNTKAAFQEAISNKNALYTKSNPGHPISYTVRFIKGNTLAKLGLATEFDITECERKPNQWVDFSHAGAYVAEFSVTWKEGSQEKSWSSGKKTAGWDYRLKLPYNATQINVKGRAETGLLWQPWNTIFDQSPPEIPCRCRFKAKGTTLNTDKDIDCQKL